MNNIIDEKRMEGNNIIIFNDQEVNMKGDTVWLTREQMAKLFEKSKSTNYYNLDMIISVGYRVNSRKGIIFRKCANML